MSQGSAVTEREAREEERKWVGGWGVQKKKKKKRKEGADGK